MIDLYDNKVGHIYSGEFDGMAWQIFINDGNYPTAYIGEQTLKVSAEILEREIQVHGGITCIPMNDEHDKDGYQWIGWDYMHNGDYSDLHPNGTKYTYENVLNDIKSVIRQYRILVDKSLNGHMCFKIENAKVSGLDKSIVASGNSFRTEIRDEEELNEKDLNRCERLGSVETGSGHDAFLNGITVIADFTAPLYWWKQAQRYHWFEFVSSQSTMHCVTKFKVEDRCVPDTNPEIIKIVQSMIDEFNATKEDCSKDDVLWHQIIASLPCGFCLSATMVTNYRQLKTMCKQRKGHRLVEWKAFIEWCCGLPLFSQLTGITTKNS